VKTIGFDSTEADLQLERDLKNDSATLQYVQPEDLLNYGLIPEFVGRLPVLATLEQLDEDALVRILREPKNALTRQFERLFELDGVGLEFTEEALRAAANQAIERKTGARGLRAIFESAMLDIMYEVPSQENIDSVVINEEVITKGAQPLTKLKNVA